MGKYIIIYLETSQVAQWLRSACQAGEAGSIPGLEISLQKETATHSNILAQEIPWTEEPVHGVTQSVGHNLVIKQQ